MTDTLGQMDAFQKIVNATRPIIVFLNVLGPIISGIWLLFLGEWPLVVVSFLVTAFIAPKVIGIALIPQMLLSGPALLFARRQKSIPTYALVSLSHLYAAALMTAWAMGTLYVIASPEALRTNATAIPHLIWAFGVAVSPWTYIALDDPEPEQTAAPILCFFLQLGFILAMLALLLFTFSHAATAVIIGVNLLLAVCVVVPWLGHRALYLGALDAIEERLHRNQ